MAFTPRRIRDASIESAVGGAGMGLIISYITRSSIPGAEMLVGCVYSALCAIVAAGLVIWRSGVIACTIYLSIPQEVPDSTPETT